MIMALLKRSTTTRRLSKPWDRGRSTIKSMVTFCQILAGISLGRRGMIVLGSFLASWHVAQPST